MDFDIAKSVFESLYSGINGYEISSRGRQKISYASKAHTYGEVTPEGFSQMLKDLQVPAGRVFYDLGSGTGKGVVLASLFGDFSKMVGIETLEDLFLESQKVLGRYKETVRPILPTEKKQQILDFIHGDFLEQDITNADVIFSHSTCFHDELMLPLERKCMSLKKGTKVLLVTKTFQSPFFRFSKSVEYPMTWGIDAVNFYEKIE